jgi:hypothetical protein
MAGRLSPIPVRKLDVFVLVKAAKLKPKFVLAIIELVAPVPPLVIATIPVTFVEELMTPIIFEARRLVRFTALLDARLLSTDEDD